MLRFAYQLNPLRSGQGTGCRHRPPKAFQRDYQVGADHKHFYPPRIRQVSYHLHLPPLGKGLECVSPAVNGYPHAQMMLQFVIFTLPFHGSSCPCPPLHN